MKKETILWGYNPNGLYGNLAIKICSNPSRKEIESRRKQGFFLREMPKGELPHESIYRIA